MKAASLSLLTLITKLQGLRRFSKIPQPLSKKSRNNGTQELFRRQKQLLAGVLNMWRRHYGEVLFGSIVRHIVEL